MNYLVLTGRILFALIFLTAGLAKFSGETIAFAASQGVPLAGLLVPVAGVLAILGGLSVALGYKAKWGALLLVAFLLPVTFMMHNFWSVADPMTAAMQQAMFFKNISMLGGALLLAYFGSGPLSLDSRLEKSRARNRELREGIV